MQHRHAGFKQRLHLRIARVRELDPAELAFVFVFVRLRGSTYEKQRGGYGGQQFAWIHCNSLGERRDRVHEGRAPYCVRQSVPQLCGRQAPEGELIPRASGGNVPAKAANKRRATGRRTTMAIRHMERHRTDRIGWLRAAVLGANDGIVSTASLVLGVAAANATHEQRDGRGDRRPGRGSDVDGCRRVRVGPLAGGFRTGRAQPGARGTQSRRPGRATRN